jgi:hypothetical protein
MARLVTLVDDLDIDQEAVEAPPIETVAFSYRGRDYEIDLGPANALAFDEIMAKYVRHARKAGTAVPTVKPTRGPARPATGGPVIQAGTAYWQTPPGCAHADGAKYKRLRDQMREWGGANGFTISASGKISQDLGDAYAARETRPKGKAKPVQEQLSSAEPPGKSDRRRTNGATPYSPQFAHAG